MLSVNSIQDMVQVPVTQNILNMNVLVEEEQLLRSMTISQDLESIMYIFTVIHAVRSTSLILPLE